MAKENTKQNKKTTKKELSEANSTVKNRKTTTEKVAKDTAKKSKSNVNDKKVTANIKKGSVSKTKNVSNKKDTSKSKKTTTPRKPKSTAKQMLTEYYDLPHGYNQTVVKVLAQTPTTLFVYWDISEEDRKALEETHGDNFFMETRPILIVHNITKNYSFEIEINDFANSWYIRTQEPNCDYVIELGRKKVQTSNQEYIYISSSNDIISPNDHILFDNSNLGNVVFKNAKTGTISSKNFGTLKSINNIDKLYGDMYDVYSRLYNDEIFNEITLPSSSEFIKKRG